MQHHKKTWLASIAIAAVMSAGCLGPMNATTRLKTWNRNIDNRWLGEGAFLVMRYIPVYSVCFLGDVLIFNSIEFWGGDNPIAPVDPADVKAIAGKEGYR